MQGIKNALKGVQYSNPQLGERLYELCRKATSRHIDRPDEILNQQVVYMINSDMHAYGAGRDAVTCLKRRLQMDHPQKQFLAIILTSKVLQECHASLGMFQGELLQEVAYILRTQHTSSPAAARTRQAAMDALRHFGAGGVDAYRQARQQGGVAPGMPAMVQTDPAAIAAERESLLDEISRLVEQARTSAELLNELILSKSEAAATGSGVQDESAALRRELLSDVRELRRLMDGYMSQLASLSGPDAEAAMKKALEAVDQLDAALTLEKDVDAEIKDLREKGQLPDPTSPAAAATPAALPPPGDAAAAAAAKMQSMNLIDLDDEPAPAAPAATAAAADPFGMGPAPVAPPLDPFAPVAQQQPAAAAAYMPPAAADMFGHPAAGGPAAVAAFPPAAPAAADPFAALAVAPTSTGVSAGGVVPSGFDEPPAFAAFSPVAATAGPPPPAAAAVPPAATSAGGADPFADAAPAWGPPSSSAPPAVSAGGFDSLAAAAAASGAAVTAAGRPSSSSGGAAPAASIPPAQQPQQQQLLGSAGMSGGGVGLPYGQQPAAAGGMYGAYGAAAATAGLQAAGSSGSGPPYGPQMGGPGGMMGPYGPAAAGMRGGPGPYPYANMPTGGYGGYGGYGAPGPYGMPVGQVTGQMGMGQVGPYPQGPNSSAAYGAAVPQMGQVGPYPSAAMGQQQQQQMPVLQQQQQPQQQPMSMGGLAPVSAPPASFGGGAAAAPDVVLSPTNPFASVPAGPAAAPVAAGGGVAGGANPFGGTNVDQEWNAFFARGQTAGK